MVSRRFSFIVFLLRERVIFSSQGTQQQCNKYQAMNHGKMLGDPMEIIEPPSNLVVFLFLLYVFLWRTSELRSGDCIKKPSRAYIRLIPFRLSIHIQLAGNFRIIVGRRVFSPFRYSPPLRIDTKIGVWYFFLRNRKWQRGQSTLRHFFLHCDSLTCGCCWRWKWRVHAVCMYILLLGRGWRSDALLACLSARLPMTVAKEQILIWVWHPTFI